MACVDTVRVYRSTGPEETVLDVWEAEMSIPESCVLDWLDAEGTVEAHAARDLIESLQKELEVSRYWGPRWEKCHAELASAQAHNKVLRSAIAKIKAHVTGEASPNWSGGEATYRSRGYLADVCEVANQPTDDTALRAALAAERKRCIAAVDAADDCGCGVPCDCYSVGTAIYAIKALGDQ